MDLFQIILCNNIWDYASDLIGASWNLEELESAALAQKISDSFSPHNFFAAFAFMEDYFNFECSSPLGKWYAKGIYVNMTCAIVRSRCYPVRLGDGRWQMISDTFEIMALLDVHDTVDIKDFSQLTCLYRFTKEIRKQEWTAVQSSYISRGSPPRKQEPCVSSDVKLAIPSAYPEERLRDGEAHGGGHGGAHGTHPESQHGNPTPFDWSRPPSESDLSSQNQDIHSEHNAETAKDDDLEEEYAVARDDQNISTAREAGAKWDHGGFGSNINGWIADLEKAEEVEEDQVVASDDGGFDHAKVMERKVKQVETRDYAERLRGLDSAMAKMQEVVNETWETGKMLVLKEANEAREVEEANEAKEANKARKAKRKANKANEAREARKAKKKANKANKANKAKRV